MNQKDIEKHVDQIMSEFVNPDGPGVAVLIGQADKVIFKKAYGLANVAEKEPLSTDHRFIMASVTKQFVGMALMLLEYRGLLAYDEPIARFFPDFPQWKNDISVRHLLQQTSGIQEYLTDDFWQQIVSHPDSVELEDLLERIKSFTDLEFVPGSKWRYCNSNYILLGSIIEKVTKTGFRQFMQQNILDPIGMHRSFAGDSGEKPPLQATGYEFKSKTEYTPAPFTREVVGWADGNLISTLDDMFLWAQSLSTDQIIPLSHKAQAFVPWKAHDPSETRYGFGQMMGERRGVREVHHGGGTLGFNTRLSRFTDEKLTVILLSNAAGIGVDRIMGAIAKILLGDKMAKLEPVQLSEEQYSRFIGVYTGKPRDHHMKLEISPDGAGLKARLWQADKFETPELIAHLVPLGSHIFLFDERTDRYLTFSENVAGKPEVKLTCLGSVIKLHNKID